MTNNIQYRGETFPIPDGYHDTVTKAIERTVDWGTKGLRIIRLRLVSDPGFPFWDVSYCHGMIGDEFVNVVLPFDQLPKGKGGINGAIIEAANADGVYAKGLGIFAPGVISTLI